MSSSDEESTAMWPCMYCGEQVENAALPAHLRAHQDAAIEKLKRVKAGEEKVVLVPPPAPPRPTSPRLDDASPVIRKNLNRERE